MFYEAKTHSRGQEQPFPLLGSAGVFLSLQLKKERERKLMSTYSMHLYCFNIIFLRLHFSCLSLDAN